MSEWTREDVLDIAEEICTITPLPAGDGESLDAAAEMLRAYATVLEEKSKLIEAMELSVGKWEEALTAKDDEIKRLREWTRVGDSLDNHHNAEACPYCNPDNLRFDKLKAEIARLTVELEQMAHMRLEHFAALADERRKVRELYGWLSVRDDQRPMNVIRKMDALGLTGEAPR